MESSSPIVYSRDPKNAVFQQLLKECSAAKQFSYSPYSKFRVGACIYTKSGKYFRGANIENASYGLCICAERTALVKCVSEGHKDIVAISVTTDLETEYCSPCGACRQFIVEFGLDIDVLLVRPDESYKVFAIKELLPMAFVPDDLEKKRMN